MLGCRAKLYLLNKLLTYELYLARDTHECNHLLPAYVFKDDNKCN